MSAEAFFDAFRALKREETGDASARLEQWEVDAVNAVRSKWKRGPEPGNPTALDDAGKFFSSVRASFGGLTTSQVEGFQTLLQAFAVAQWPISWAAYGLATPWHETNETMEPVAEAYFLGHKADAYRQGLRYFPWYGRGYVQLTWRGDDQEQPYGYLRADNDLELAGALLADPDMALQPEIAAKILVKGMSEGWFTGKKLSDFLPEHAASRPQFQQARRIINGMDKADLIAGYALQFQTALDAGGWR